MSGTVNISRDLWDDKAFKPEPFTEREAWIWMIMDASYKARSKPAGKIWVDLERGQLATSVRFMCDAWGWSKSRVDRFLKRLENRDMIGTDSGTGINVITICKYDDYQNKPNHSGTANSEERDTSGTAAGQQRDKPNKGLIPDVIQGKVEAKASLSPSVPKKRAPTGSRIPDDWTLSKHLGDWSINEGATEPLVRSEADKFRDYWKGVAGAKGRKADWDATWRNWIRRAIENTPTPKLKTINGGRNDQPSQISENRISDPALEHIARLAGVGKASGDGRV